MNEDLKTYRIRTKVGEEKPTLLNVQLNQTYDMFEILSLKINQNNAYKYYSSDYGVIVGRVLANGGVGIPNAKVSIFIPTEESVNDIKKYILYRYSTVQSTNDDGIRYNLLPDEIDEICHQNIGTFPNKRLVLDNKDVMEIFDKYWKYTTVTNDSGDYMLYGIPTGSQQLHVDIDLSDIGIWSQRPRDLVYKGFNINQFESPNKFKVDNNLNSLSQVYTQDKGLYVYPYWGETSENYDTIGITRCDIQIDYKFEPTCIFMGCAVTDTGNNAIGKNCASTDNIGKMSELVSSEGSIHMIRRTFDGRVEEYSIKGNRLIDQDGVWCYQIPMNLDYVMTDEYGNLVPSDNTEKGIPTRTRVRFRFVLDETKNDNTARKRCMYLVPNNPRIDNELYSGFSSDESHTPDYEFGSNTKDEDFCDMFWNKVYTVKNYIPRFQKNRKVTNRKHTGIKLVNHYGDNNPIPYNNLTIKLTFTYRLICVLTDMFIKLIGFLNNIFTIISAGPCLAKQLLDTIIKGLCFKLPLIHIKPLCWLASPLKTVRKVVKFLILPCMSVSSEFCEGNTTHSYTFYPGCGCKGLGKVVSILGLCNCIWEKQKADHNKDENKKQDQADRTTATNNSAELKNCYETQLAEDNDAVSFNFQNDWINGMLYFPMWYRKITPKKRFLFGLIKRKAKDQWCSNQHYYNGKVFLFNSCSVKRDGRMNYNDPVDNKINNASIMKDGGCGGACHKSVSEVGLNHGVIVTNTTMLGQTAYYYKPLEYDAKLKDVKLLFATDIVLLGSLNDCDIHGIPQFFKSLTSTTYNLPPNILFTDNNFIPSFNEDGSIKDGVYDQISVSEMTGCDWGNKNDDICPESGTNSGLFYSIGCSKIELRPKSCINAIRICEFGVSLDETKEIANLLKLQNDTTNSTYDTLVPDGFISKDEVYNVNERSMFATLNGNQLKTINNSTTGLKEYDFRYMYVDNFDGSLENVMSTIQKRCPSKYKYRNNYKLEEFSPSYYHFRMGKYNFYYDHDRKFPRYENSFYFYFGLKSGRTAIEKFNSQFFSDCENDTEMTPPISLIPFGNNWCENNIIDGKRENNNGCLLLDISNITPVQKIIIKSTTRSDFVYSTSQTVNDPRIYIGKFPKNNEKYDKNKWQDYSTKFTNAVNTPLVSLPNGSYEINITDEYGNIASYNTELKSPFLQFDTKVTTFTVADNTLLEMFSNDKNDINVTRDNIGKDNTGNNIGQDHATDATRDIGGTIVISNICDGLDHSPITKTCITVKCGDYQSNIIWDGKTTIIGQDNDKGIHYLGHYKDFSIMFGVPEGDKNYEVIVTQLCSVDVNNNIIVSSENTVSEFVNVSKTIPYKLYINDIIDYDVIRNDKYWYTGYDLSYNKNNLVVTRNKSRFVGEGWKHMSDPKYYDFSQLISYQNIKDEIIVLLESLISAAEMNVEAAENASDDSGITYNNGIIDEVKKCIVYINSNTLVFGDGENTLNTFRQMIGNLNIGTEYQDIKDSLIGNDATEGLCDKIQQIEEEFILSMKETFWFNCPTEIKDIYFTTTTSFLPVAYKTFWREEKVKEDTGDEVVYTLASDNMTEAFNKYDGFEDIMIPTITSKYNTEYYDAKKSISVGDGAYYTYVKNYDTKYSDKKIKQPYFVSVQNSRGNTVNDDGTVNFKGDIIPLQQDKQIPKLFGFHIIDKQLSVDCVTWSPIISIPYYVTDEKDKRYGKTINVNGIFAGRILNGSASSYYSKDEGGIKNFVNFDEQRIGSSRLELYTQRKPNETDIETEDRIPVIRTIVGEENNQGFIERYNVGNNDYTKNDKQYINLKNKELNLELSDSIGCQLDVEIETQMIVVVNEDSVHDCDDKKNNVLSVQCPNGSGNTFFVFHVSKNNPNEYPLNLIDFNNNTYRLDYENKDIPWEKGGKDGKYLFSVATQYETLVNQCDKNALILNDDLTVDTSAPKGYSSGGNFSLSNANDKESMYFVIVNDKNNCRAISPLYDFWSKPSGKLQVATLKTASFGDDNVQKRQRKIDENGDITKEYVMTEVVNTVLSSIYVVKYEWEVQNTYYLRNFPYSLKATITEGSDVMAKFSANNISGDSEGYVEIDEDTYNRMNKYGHRKFKGRSAFIATDCTGLPHKFKASDVKQSQGLLEVIFDLNENSAYGDTYSVKEGKLKYLLNVGWGAIDVKLKAPRCDSDRKTTRFYGWSPYEVAEWYDDKKEDVDKGNIFVTETDQNDYDHIINLGQNSTDNVLLLYAVWQTLRAKFKIRGVNGVKWGNGSINDINVNFEEEDTEEGVQISAICNAVPVNVDTTKKLTGWSYNSKYVKEVQVNDSNTILYLDREIIKEWKATTTSKGGSYIDNNFEIVLTPIFN